MSRAGRWVYDHLVDTRWRARLSRWLCVRHDRHGRGCRGTVYCRIGAPR